MKILFVNPSLRPESPHRQLPPGLGYVMTNVKEHGFDFDLLDIDIGRLTDAEVEAYLGKHSYDVVAFGAIVTHYAWCKWFIHCVRRLQPDATIVVGNSVGESIPEVLFAESPVDIVVQGEGDVTMVEVLKALNEGRSLGTAREPEEYVPHQNVPYPATLRGDGVEGVIFRDAKGRIVRNPARKAVLHIDELPFPDWDLFDVQRYIDDCRGMVRGATRFFPQDEARMMPVSTARGCVFRCTFCHFTFWNDPYRHRSAGNVVSEIKRNQQKYGTNYVNFWDDLTFHKLGPAEKFVDALIEADLGVHWTAAIRSDLFGRPDLPREDRLRVAEKFRDAGAVSVFYSLESGNDEILKAMNKRVEAEYFSEQVNLLREVKGLVSSTSIVLGYPQETPETIAETMELCRQLRIYPSPGFLLPLPGTEMWRYAVENDFITESDKFLSELTERQDIILNMTGMSNEQLQSEVEGWLGMLNRDLNIGLNEGSLIRTGGTPNQTKNQIEEVRSYANLKPNLNYAAVDFVDDAGSS